MGGLNKHLYRKWLLVLILLCSNLASTSFAAKKYVEPSTFFGPTNLSNQTMATMKSFGPTRMHDCIVLQTAEIFGPLSAYNSSFEQIIVRGPVHGEGLQIESAKVMGPVSLDNSKIERQLKIFGPLDAIDCTFSDIIVTTSRAKLVNSSAEKITVGASNSNEQQILYLQGDTNIGSIKFESGHGQIILLDQQPKVHKIQGAVVKLPD